MKILDKIKNIFRRKDATLWTKSFGVSMADIFSERLPFSDTIFSNCCDILTDLCNDVTFTLKNKRNDIILFADFKVFFEREGKAILNRLFETGFVVIGYHNGFRVLSNDEYTEETTPRGVAIRPHGAEQEVYVMRSTTYITKRKSDLEVCAPFLRFLDNILNASNTVCARLGALVLLTPENSPAAPTQVVLTEKQKEDLEREMASEYGALSRQKQLMLLPRAMRTQVISLAGMDIKTNEKARLAILAICDRLKVPANQVAIIDANSSKALSNGSELREGDFAKYQSFERLLNSTFVQMAQAMGLDVDYSIYNKPTRTI